MPLVSKISVVFKNINSSCILIFCKGHLGTELLLSSSLASVFLTNKLRTIYLKTEHAGEARAWAALISGGLGERRVSGAAVCGLMDLLGSFCDTYKGENVYQI